MWAAKQIDIDLCSKSEGGLKQRIPRVSSALFQAANGRTINKRPTWRYTSDEIGTVQAGTRPLV